MSPDSSLTPLWTALATLGWPFSASFSKSPPEALNHTEILSKMTAAEPSPSNTESTQVKDCYICKSTEEPLLNCITCLRFCDSTCACIHDSQSSQVQDPDKWQCPDCLEKTTTTGLELPPITSNTPPKNKAAPKKTRRSTPLKRLRLASPPSCSPKHTKNEPEEAFQDEAATLLSALDTIKTHMSSYQNQFIRNDELQEEVSHLRQQLNEKDQHLWEMKDYTENLEENVRQLRSECCMLRDTLHKIRGLSSVGEGDMATGKVSE